MLALPEEGMNWSVGAHNSKLGIFCDWMEASLLFGDAELSKSDVIDFLIENNIYADQSFAEEFVTNAWSILRRRMSHVSVPLGIDFSGDYVSRANDWAVLPAYAFCLIVTCATYLYPVRARAWGRSINDQGVLFERLCEKSLQARYHGWTIRRMGWSAENPVRLIEIIEEVIGEINELEGAEKDLYVDSHANELGLDLLLYQHFADNHACFPLFMIQCASGKDWKLKRKTPDLSIWEKVISFNSRPVKGFSIPYAFVDEMEFRKETNTVSGIFFERYRIVSPLTDHSEWLGEGLRAEIISWVSPLVAQLPLASVTL